MGTLKQPQLLKKSVRLSIVNSCPQFKSIVNILVEFVNSLVPVMSPNFQITRMVNGKCI